MENRNVLPNGTLLQGGRLQVVCHLGSGGFGNTYQVVDTANGQPLAMKEFYLKGVNEREADSRTVSVSNDDNKDEFEAQKEKFRKEALRLSNIHHPNVVGVYGMFEENGTAYYVMEFLQGQSLAARMRSLGHPMTEQEVMNTCVQLLNALDAVHQQNIWHLDLKPGNVMMGADGRVVLIDFGASKQFHDTDGRSLSTSTGLCYTPGYAPTEQIANENNRIGPWTDLYALGATMYNLLTGQTPPSVSAIQDGEAFRFPPTVTPQTQRLVRWLMEPNRNHRPQSVDDVRRSLGLLPNYDDEDDGKQNSSKEWWIAGGILAAIAVVALLLWLFVFSDGKTPRRNFHDDEEEEEEEYYEETQAEDEEDYRNAMPVDTVDYEEMAREADRRQAEEARQLERQRLQEERQRQEELRRQEEQCQRERAEQTPLIVPDDDDGNDNRVYEVVEQMPQFPGGTNALIQYLSSNVHYPPVAEENGIQGRVVCTFIVERDGSISDVRVVKNVDPSLDKEAVRVIKSMPRWSPGRQNGSPIRVKYTIPVTFRLQ